MLGKREEVSFISKFQIELSHLIVSLADADAAEVAIVTQQASRKEKVPPGGIQSAGICSLGRDSAPARDKGRCLANHNHGIPHLIGE